MNKILFFSTVLILNVNLMISQPLKNNVMSTKNENIGLLVTLRAKPGNEQKVRDFLLGGLPVVEAEKKTVAWFAFQIDDTTFGIYDTFEVEAGRQAHLTGEVAKALLASAGELLDNFDAAKDIQAIDLVASNHKAGGQNNGLLVIMKAKEGKGNAVSEFLKAGAGMVGNEPDTLSWYAFQIDELTYGIFDTFSEDQGRDAHLTGDIAAALMQNAPQILDGFEPSAIKKIAILASK